MDIKRDEAFEEAYAEICKPIIRRPYPRNQNGEYVYKEIHEAHLMWQQAQKVAVPEPTKEVICAIENTVEDQLIASGITSDPFRLDGEKIYKAMIEAQEPTND